jgi:hypothetical protein
MQLIPSLVLQHLSNPANIEELFIKYIEKAGLRIDSSKTIAGVAYYHKKQFTASASSAQFFSGTYVNAETNMPGNSFIRPQSEHVLIWAMRVETAPGADLFDLAWLPGAGNGSTFMLNTNMTITTNSEVKIKSYPLSESLNDLTVRENGIIPFAEPIFWGGQQDFVVDVVGQGGKSALATDNMKLTLIGLGLI